MNSNQNRKFKRKIKGFLNGFLEKFSSELDLWETNDEWTKEKIIAELRDFKRIE